MMKGDNKFQLHIQTKYRTLRTKNKKDVLESSRYKNKMKKIDYNY